MTSKPSRTQIALCMACALQLLSIPDATAFVARQPSPITVSTHNGLLSPSPLSLTNKPSGTFFNPVPNDDDNDNNNEGDSQEDLDKSLEKLMKERKSPSLASQPSTINGVPTSQAGVGFGATKKTEKKEQSTKPYVGIGAPDAAPPINDVTKPEYDDQGYTVYTDEETGEKSRVFEALVDYPCDFTMKIVGANEGTFVEEMLQVVADSCQVEDPLSISYSTRNMGKWTSVTVQAPVKSAQMLYQLYENVDRDPRVKFKF